MRPRLSVVVVCINNLDALHRCLAALVPQLSPGQVELLAVGHWGDRGNASARFSEVRWVSAPAAATVPQMRAQGLKESRGDIVALLEDDCVVGDGWCGAVIRAHEAPSPVIGGPIEPGASYSSLDWAVYFSEYGRFMAPFSGPVAALPGNNVSYKSAILPELDGSQGFEEVFFHWHLQQSGVALLAAPDLAVACAHHWPPTAVTSIPFHHGRAFAASRATRFPLWRRWAYGAVGGALPPLKAARVAREVALRRRHAKAFCRSLAWLCLFMASWSLGEITGYLFGAGDSASRWR